MLQTILATQQPGKAAPELYQLLVAYLARLPITEDPAMLAASFQLKTLRVEGLFTPKFACTSCGAVPARESFHTEQGVYCASHAPLNSLAFSQEERDILLLLAFCRDFNIFKNLLLDRL